MPTALKNGALTTLSVLKDALGITATDTTSDDRLRRAINVATAQIERYLDRKLARATIVDEIYATKGGPRLVLKRAPIVTLTAISITGTVPAPIDPTLYQIEDAEAGIVYTRFGFTRRSQRRWGIAGDTQPGSEPPDLLVSYDGGYVTPEQADEGGAYAGEDVTLPDDIEQAAIELSGHVFRTDVGFNAGEVASEKLGDASISYRDDTAAQGTGDRAIPVSIRAKLVGLKTIAIV